MARELLLPADFHDHAWEVEAKGVFWGASVRINDRVVDVTFYDPVRLSQDIAEELGQCLFTELRRVLVVPCVTEEQMRMAVERASAEFFA